VETFGGRMISDDQPTLGRQSGEYSPPALCFALTAISSAISLEVGGGRSWLEGVLGCGEEWDLGRTVGVHAARLVAFRLLGEGYGLRWRELC